MTFLKKYELNYRCSGFFRYSLGLRLKLTSNLNTKTQQIAISEAKKKQQIIDSI